MPTCQSSLVPNWTKARQVAILKAQVAEKTNLLARYVEDRKALLPKQPSKASERLQELVTAAETVRSYLRYYANQQQSLTGLASEIKNLRENQAPVALRLLKERYQKAGLDEDGWNRFLLEYTGDVDGAVAAKSDDTEKNFKVWKGTRLSEPIDANGTFLKASMDPKRMPLAVLEAEIGRLEKLVATDKDTANKLTAVTRKIAEATTVLERLEEKGKDCAGARARAEALVADREQCYVRVFDAILSEERVLNELYAPLMHRLRASGGSLATLSCSVKRVADVSAWAKWAEDKSV